MKMELKRKRRPAPVNQAKIDAQFAGDLEETIENNWGEKLQKIKEFEKKFRDRWKFEGDGEFYFSVCFTSAEERDKFIETNRIMLREGMFIFADELPERIIPPTHNTGG